MLMCKVNCYHTLARQMPLLLLHLSHESPNTVFATLPLFCCSRDA